MFKLFLALACLAGMQCKPELSGNKSPDEEMILQPCERVLSVVAGDVHRPIIVTGVSISHKSPGTIFIRTFYGDLYSVYEVRCPQGKTEFKQDNNILLLE